MAFLWYDYAMGVTLEEVEQIKELLPMLPETAVREVKDFVSYLIDREQRRKALEKRVIKAEKETPLRFHSAGQAMKAIRNEAKA